MIQIAKKKVPNANLVISDIFFQVEVFSYVLKNSLFV